MKKLLLILLMVSLVGGCVHGGVAPPRDDHPCPEGKYWSTTSQACQEYPKSL
jgi:hypothetical protein